jgi:uncharacterized FlaG/YvyC family protein
MDSAIPVTGFTSGVTSGIVSGSTSSTVVSPAERAFTVAVSTAVRTLNESGILGDGREVTFSVDRATRRPIVQVVDTSTKEVINQWPPEYALRLAQSNQTQTQDGAQIQDESILRANDNVG